MQKINSTISISANKKYSYKDIHYNHTLDEWVNIAHFYLSEKSGWKFYPLKPGAFGYDNLVVSLVYLFNNLAKEPLRDGKKSVYDEDLESMASAVHEGWIENYKFWRDNSPFLTNNFYKKPASALGDERRENCAKTVYYDLPEDEKEKDRSIVFAVLDQLQKDKAFLPVYMSYKE